MDFLISQSEMQEPSDWSYCMLRQNVEGRQVIEVNWRGRNDFLNLVSNRLETGFIFARKSLVSEPVSRYPRLADW